MSSAPFPPLQQLLTLLHQELTWVQVLIRPQPHGFELRHVQDRSADPATLQSLPLPELRSLALQTASGLFRPLRCAPNLRPGWRCQLLSPNQLADALHLLYPGTLPDWWATQTNTASPANFESVARQQLGRAAILSQLPPASLASITAAACNPNSCLKHRRWTGPGLDPDPADTKSLAPCLEPCPLFLAFARACAEAERQLSVPVELAPDDLATLAAALRHAITSTPAGLRPGDLADPLHPWRIARLLDRHQVTWNRAASPSHAPDE